MELNAENLNDIYLIIFGAVLGLIPLLLQFLYNSLVEWRKYDLLKKKIKVYAISEVHAYQATLELAKKAVTNKLDNKNSDSFTEESTLFFMAKEIQKSKPDVIYKEDFLVSADVEFLKYLALLRFFTNIVHGIADSAIQIEKDQPEYRESFYNHMHKSFWEGVNKQIWLCKLITEKYKKFSMDSLNEEDFKDGIND